MKFERTAYSAEREVELVALVHQTPSAMFVARDSRGRQLHRLAMVGENGRQLRRRQPAEAC